MFHNLRYYFYIYPILLWCLLPIISIKPPGAVKEPRKRLGVFNSSFIPSFRKVHLRRRLYVSVLLLFVYHTRSLTDVKQQSFISDVLIFILNSTFVPDLILPGPNRLLLKLRVM